MTLHQTLELLFLDSSCEENERQATDQEKIIANQVFSKRL